MTPCERLIHINERVSRKPEVGGLRVCAPVVTPQIFNYYYADSRHQLYSKYTVHSHVDYRILL